MALSSDLVSQFSKVMNDSNDKTVSNMLRGTITKYDESLFVQLDGSSELTPISRTVEVNEGDRVEVSIANHAATVTGNLSAPSIGIVTEGNLRSEIAQSASTITLTVEDSNGHFTTYKQDISAFYFVDEEGTVKINGGSIDATNLNLTGAITWGDLASDTLEVIGDIQDDIGTIQDDVDKAQARADAAYNLADGFYWPSYIERTYIDGARIESPTIEGNDIIARTAFQVTPVGTDEDGEEVEVPCGAMGVAFGSGFDDDGKTIITTYGIAMADSTTTVNSYGYITTESTGQYVIVTNKGVRLQAGTNNITVTKNGAFYNGDKLGTGTAVFG